MLRVGLTGGIGSGKSTVSALLAQHGAVVIDADLLARDVTRPGTPGLAEVVLAFGPDLVDELGELDRAALGARVFSDPVARRRLEQIIHPRVRSRASEIEAQAPPDAVVVHDIPLLVETGQQDRFDQVVVVDSSPDTQVARLMRDRKMTSRAARDRLAAQATRDQRLAAADQVITNDGSQDDLRQAVQRLWEALSERARQR